MFKDLLVFEKQRTGKEAFGFFLAYLLFSGLLVGIITSFFSTSVAPSGFAEGFEQGLEEGQAVGAYFYSVLSLALSALILFRKGHLKSFGFVLIGLSSGVLALFLVAFLGLVPTAYLTTIKPVVRVPDGNA